MLAIIWLAGGCYLDTAPAPGGTPHVEEIEAPSKGDPGPHLDEPVPPVPPVEPVPPLDRPDLDGPGARDAGPLDEPGMAPELDGGDAPDAGVEPQPDDQDGDAHGDGDDPDDGLVTPEPPPEDDEAVPNWLEQIALRNPQYRQAEVLWRIARAMSEGANPESITTALEALAEISCRDVEDVCTGVCQWARSNCDACAGDPSCLEAIADGCFIGCR